MAKYDVWRERIDPGDPNDADEAFREHQGYRTVRVLMKEAPDTMAALAELDISDMFAYMNPEDDGVMQWTR